MFCKELPASKAIKMFMEYMGMTGIFSFITVVIAAPVLEELIFRGIILDGLLKRYTPILSSIMSSIIFGLVHLNPLQFIGGLTFGGFSGWVYFRTKSLLPSIIIHASVNLTIFILNFLYPDPSMNNSLVEFYGGIFNLILIISGSITILLACIIFLWKEFLKGDIKSGSIQTSNIITPGFLE